MGTFVVMPDSYADSWQSSTSICPASLHGRTGSTAKGKPFRFVHVEGNEDTDTAGTLLNDWQKDVWLSSRFLELLGIPADAYVSYIAYWSGT